MKQVLRFITRFYASLLRLYPGKFRSEFGEEMQSVFNEAASEAASNKKMLVMVFLREILDLPVNLIREHWRELVHRKDPVMNEGIEHTGDTEARGVPFKKERSSRWEALIGVLPFLGFGLISMYGELRSSSLMVYPYLAFYLLVLSGLIIGGLKDFPRWAFSYIGWSLLFVWLLCTVRTQGLTFFGITFQGESIAWGIGVITLFDIAIGLPLLWKRSLHPLKELFTGIWHDWPRLSLTMYTFLAWLSLISYDENHHPYLLAFILVSTLVATVAAWGFLRSNTTKGQVLVLVAGIAVAQIFSSLAWATWDWQTYHGLPPSEPDAWYVSALRTLLILATMSVWMFWPSVVGLMKRSINGQKTT